VYGALASRNLAVARSDSSSCAGQDFVQSVAQSVNAFLEIGFGWGAQAKEQTPYGFEDITNFMVYSHEVGMAKPDPRSLCTDMRKTWSASE
jgi:hypothetical protein